MVQSLVQEVIRRMLSTSKGVEDSTKMEILDNFAQKNTKFWVPDWEKACIREQMQAAQQGG